MSLAPIEAISALASAEIPSLPMASAPAAARTGDFESLLLEGVNRVDSKLQAADAQAAAFAIDDSIPPHQVMFALEDARLSFELMLQIRSRLVEGYQDIMRMQL